MLRKNPTLSAPSSARGGRYVDRFDNEKGSKMKQQKESQTKAIFFCLGIISLLGLIAKVKVNHLHKFTAKRLRKRSHALAGQNEKSIDIPGAIDFLPPHSIYKQEVEDIYGEMINFSKFQGMVTLVVNVACSWGKTQVSYTELAELQEMYSSKGFSVLAFPISDFNQELGSNEEILSYVHENFPQVDFPLFGLSNLDESPVYQSIRKQKPEETIRWNFYKFLVDRNGRVVEVFDLKVNPLKIADRIEKILHEASRAGGQKLVMS